MIGFVRRKNIHNSGIVMVDMMEHFRLYSFLQLSQNNIADKMHSMLIGLSTCIGVVTCRTELLGEIESGNIEAHYIILFFVAIILLHHIHK